MAGRVAGKAIVLTEAHSGMGRASALGLAPGGATTGVLDVADSRYLTGQIVMIDGEWS